MPIASTSKLRRPHCRIVDEDGVGKQSVGDWLAENKIDSKMLNRLQANAAAYEAYSRWRAENPELAEEEEQRQQQQQQAEAEAEGAAVKAEAEVAEAGVKEELGVKEEAAGGAAGGAVKGEGEPDGSGSGEGTAAGAQALPRVKLEVEEQEPGAAQVRAAGLEQADVEAVEAGREGAASPTTDGGGGSRGVSPTPGSFSAGGGVTTGLETAPSATPSAAAEADGGASEPPPSPTRRVRLFHLDPPTRRGLLAFVAETRGNLAAAAAAASGPTLTAPPPPQLPLPLQLLPAMDPEAAALMATEAPLGPTADLMDADGPEGPGSMAGWALAPAAGPGRGRGRGRGRGYYGRGGGGGAAAAALAAASAGLLPGEWPGWPHNSPHVIGTPARLRNGSASTAPHGCVGHSVRLFWMDDVEWYEADVAGYDPASGRHYLW